MTGQYTAKWGRYGLYTVLRGNNRFIGEEPKISKQFRYKTATREERIAHARELIAGQRERKAKRQVHGLIRTASHMVIEHDINKRGVSSHTAWGCFQQYEKDLTPFVEAELKSGIDHIRIPRKAAKAYIAECEANGT